MLIDFLFELKKAGLPVSLREFLTLIEGLNATGDPVTIKVR